MRNTQDWKGPERFQHPHSILRHWCMQNLGLNLTRISYMMLVSRERHYFYKFPLNWTILTGLVILPPLKKDQKRCSRIRECRKSSRDRAGDRTRGETRAHARAYRILPEFEPKTYCWRCLAIPLRLDRIFGYLRP